MPESEERMESSNTPEAKEVKESNSVLEIGSANEPFFKKFEQFEELRQEIKGIAKYIASDIHDGVADVTKFDTGNFSLDKVIANGVRLPFGNDVFDRVIISDVFTYRVMPEGKVFEIKKFGEMSKQALEKKNPSEDLLFMKSLLDEALRVLKSGGKIIVADKYRILHAVPYRQFISSLKVDPRFQFSEQEWGDDQPKAAAIYYLEKKKPPM